MRALALLAPFLLLACRGQDKAMGTGAGDTDLAGSLSADSAEDADLDDDGWDADGDCDDGYAGAYPGAPETCDGVDNDCDGETDEDAADAPRWYPDVDLDGFGDPQTPVRACDPPEGTWPTGEDCDDLDRTVYPGAPEICGDGVLNDCDGDAEAARAGCVRVGELSVGDFGLPVVGIDEDSEVGGSVSLGGDANADGRADLLMGGTGGVGPDGQTGGAWLVAGPLNSNRTVSGAEAAVYGTVEGDGVGKAVTLWPDAAGDGHAALVVSARQTSAVGEDSGGTWVFYGPVGGPHPTDEADRSFTPSGPGERLGWSLAAGGDLDGDGGADLALGGYSDSLGGLVAVYGGGAESGPLATLVGAGLPLDGALSARGDADGDGVADLAVGDASGAGQTWLVLGPIRGLLALADADLRVVGEQGADAAGTSVSLDGDVDGDGSADLSIGAPGVDGAGVATLVLNPAGRGALSLSDADATLRDGRSALLGTRVALGGDLDGDGTADWVASDPEASREGIASGVALVCYSPIEGGAPTADLVLWGKATGDRLGAALSSDGDQDADGTDDLLLGAPGDADHVAAGGMAWLIFGRGL